LLTSFSLPFGELTLVYCPLTWLTKHRPQCYDTVGWVI